MTIFGAILFASVILTSCGGEKKESTDSKVESTEESNSVKTNPEPTVPSPEISDKSPESPDETDSSSMDCDQFITDYEKFVDSYIAIIKKMKANPSDPSILTEYTEMASESATMQDNAKNCKDPKYVSKLAKLTSKMTSAASGM